MKFEVSRDLPLGHKVVVVDEAWSARIVSRHGDCIEIIERNDGSFTITTTFGRELTVQTTAARNQVVLKVQR